MLQVSCLQAFQSPTTTVSGMACTMSLNSVIGPSVLQGQYTEITLVNLLLWTMSTNAAFLAAPLVLNVDGGCFLVVSFEWSDDALIQGLKDRSCILWNELNLDVCQILPNYVWRSIINKQDFFLFSSVIFLFKSFRYSWKSVDVIQLL